MTIRPAALIRLYWQELLVIEERAKFLEPVYFWEIETEDRSL
jgi:hypothetical protein